MEPELPSLRLRTEQAARDLEKLGYAVIRGVLTRDEAQDYHRRIWDCLTRASDGVLAPDRDYKSMAAKDLPAHKHGISESYRLNHSPPVRELRRRREFLDIYKWLYGEKKGQYSAQQMTCSMDRINFKFPGRPYKSQGDWPHMDQCPRQLGRITIQSYVSLTDAPPEAPGNRLYEGSHAVFAERWAYLRTSEKRDGWQMLNEQEASDLGEVCPLVKPVLEAGDMLLWDSRTVHSPSDGTDFSMGRCVVYLCYSPLWEALRDEKFWAKKKAAFEDCRATTHKPVPQKLFAKMPRAYGGVKPVFGSFDKQKLGITDEPIGVERLLFGFDKYDDDKHRLFPDEQLAEPLLTFVSPFMPMLPGQDEQPLKKTKK